MDHHRFEIKFSVRWLIPIFIFVCLICYVCVLKTTIRHQKVQILRYQSEVVELKKELFESINFKYGGDQLEYPELP